MIDFPATPALGEIWVANNAVTYEWLGNRWSSMSPILAGATYFYYNGGTADTWPGTTTGPTDIVLYGGNAYSFQ